MTVTENMLHEKENRTVMGITGMIQSGYKRCVSAAGPYSKTTGFKPLPNQITMIDIYLRKP